LVEKQLSAICRKLSANAARMETESWQTEG
jgi:hypothetical protein